MLIPGTKSFAQNAKVNIVANNISISELISKIEEQTDYLFVYNKNEIDASRKVDVKSRNETVSSILSTAFKGTNVTFTQEGNHIVLSNKTTPLPAPAKQNKKGITGSVTDAYGEALVGATLVSLSSKQGAVTDANGNFNVLASVGEVLEVIYLGMKPQEIIVTDANEYNIVMEEKGNTLDEVTVVAFARQKKESVISAISTIKPSELKVPSSNLTTALGGRLAGIISYQQSGEPGRDNANFFIRGVTTFGYKTNPLILIDNIELTADDLARLNVDDIAQFSIMKDATATALYGARGANGVILVTTKEGKEGKAKISVRIENSVSAPVQMVKMADPITYMRLANEAVITRNPLGVPPYSQSKIDNTIKGTNAYYYPTTDWYNELFNDYTMNQRVNMNISGGGTVARYYIAASYYKDNGVLKMDKQNDFNSNISIDKYSVRSNINIDISKTTEVIVRVHGSFDNYTGPLDNGDELFSKVMRTDPVSFPRSYPGTGDDTHILFGNDRTGTYINPYADMLKGYKEYSRNMVLAQGEVKQKLDIVTKGLNARLLINTTNYSFADATRAYSPFYYIASGYDRLTDSYSLTEVNSKGENRGTEGLKYTEGDKEVINTTYAELAVNYNRDFGKHGVSAMLVGILQNKKVTSTSKEKQLTNDKKSLILGFLPYRNEGISGRFTYAFDSRYFTEFNFGYNGSERFYKTDRFGFFPSVGLGYVISNESFWEPFSKKINKLKLKATYGLVGNDDIGDEGNRFFYMSNVNDDDGDKSQQFGKNYEYGGNGISVQRYANNSITWETAKKTNLGFELGLLNQFELQADFFHEYRDNIMNDRSLPTTMGLMAKARSNLGEASSRGVDISLDYSYITNKNFWLSSRANFTYATSRYEKWEEPDYATFGMPYRSRVGKNLSQEWGYIAERLFIDEEDVVNSPTQQDGIYGAGDIKYKDINRDGIINDGDLVFLGFPTTPEITYGFGASAGYRGFDLSVFFQGNARSSFFLDPKKIAPFIDTNEKDNITSRNALLAVIADNHWSEGNRNLYAFWPRLSDKPIENNFKKSTWWMHDGSFFRVKTLELGYSLPEKWMKKAGMSSCRIYVTGNNLLCISKFKLWDPEMGDNGLGYPIQRVFNAGVNINF
jgi:TonB-linked SusC/RagA family outer membrane protein